MIFSMFLAGCYKTGEFYKYQSLRVVCSLVHLAQGVCSVPYLMWRSFVLLQGAGGGRISSLFYWAVVVLLRGEYNQLLKCYNAPMNN
jgi:hypothetical protein